MGVHRAVLETPQKAHEERDPVELVHHAIRNSHECHQRHNCDIASTCYFRTESVHDVPDEEATEDLPESEPDHGVSGQLEFSLVVAVNGVRHQCDKVPGEESYGDASPEQLRDEEPESFIRYQFPHRFRYFFNVHLFK